MHGANSKDEISRPPFLLEYRSEEVRRDGGFVPRAWISWNGDFGGSGLLHCMASDDLVTLLLAVSQVTPEGSFVATPEVLAPVLGVSPGAMRRRLERLASLRWQGQPLVREVKAESGLCFFMASSHLFKAESNAIIPIPQDKQARDVLPPEEPPLAPSRREESVACSRRLYARPRAEVEKEIDRFLGAGRHGDRQRISKGVPISEAGAIGETEAHQLSERTQLDEVQPVLEGRRWLALKKRLQEAGLSHTQAKGLLGSYPFERIERQLEWLPHRDARSPVAYLLASVAGDYAPPRSILSATSLPLSMETESVDE